MEKKILVVSFAVIGAVALALGGCGAQETGGRAGIEVHMDLEELVASDTYDEDSEIENYMSEADGFRAQGSLEKAEVYYQRAYENLNDQQALIEIIHMWQEAKNVSKTDEWINYVKENCSDMNEELLEIIAQAESGQNASWMIVNVKYQEVFNGTEEEEKNRFVEYDEYGRIIRSEINFQEATLKPSGGHFNPTSYWTYEYQDEYKVKVCKLPQYVLNMPKEELELIQANAQKIVDYTKNNMQEEEKRYKDVYGDDLYNGKRRKALELKDFLERYDDYYDRGVVTEELWGLCENLRQSLPQEENFGYLLDYFASYSIYTYDNEGRVITIKEYFCDELDYTKEYSYKTTHTIALGEGGLNTDKSAEIYDSRDGRTSSATISYTGKKIGVFGIIDEYKGLADDIENIFDDYGNLSRQTKITYGARNTTHKKLSFQYVYCTPEEYLAAKETGDFSAYPMSGLPDITND